MQRLTDIITKIEGEGLQPLRIKQGLGEGFSSSNYNMSNVLERLLAIVLEYEKQQDDDLLKAAIYFLQTVEIGKTTSQENTLMQSATNLAVNLSGNLTNTLSSVSFSLWSSIKKPAPVVEAMEVELKEIKPIDSMQPIQAESVKNTLKNWLVQKKIQTPLFSNEDLDLAAEINNQILKSFDSKVNVCLENGSYFSPEDLKFLEDVYGMLKNLLPAYSRKILADEDGFIASNEIKKYFDLKNSTADTAIVDFKRNYKIQNVSGGTKEECLKRIENLISKSSYSDQEKVLVEAWLAKFGGQDCNISLNCIEPAFPVYTQASTDFANWSIRNGKAHFCNSMSISELFFQAKNDTKDPSMYVLMCFDKVVREIAEKDLVEWKATSELAKTLPSLLNYTYQLRLDVKDGVVIPRMIKAGLRSDHIDTSTFRLLELAGFEVMSTKEDAIQIEETPQAELVKAEEVAPQSKLKDALQYGVNTFLSKVPTIQPNKVTDMFSSFLATKNSASSSSATRDEPAIPDALNYKL